MKVTIKDIAKQTGISTSTISRVVSGRGYVAEETRKKVNEAINTLGYEYNPAAGQKKSLDMVMIVIGHMYNTVYDENIAGIGSIFEAMNIFYVGAYGSNFDPELQEKYIMRAIRNKFKGLIILSPIETPSFIKIMNNCKIPFVTMNRPLENVNADQICMDNKAAGSMAVNHLYEKGHKKIMFVGSVNSSSTEYRKKGYIAGMKEHNLNFDETDIMLVKNDYDAGVNAGSYIAVAKKEVTAIYVANELIGTGIVAGLRKCGLSVPEDISIVCTDNTNLSERCVPKLTTVACNHYGMGAEAAKLFIERMNNPCESKKQMFFKPGIIERDSVAKI